MNYLCFLKTPLLERSLDPVSKDNSDVLSSHPPRPLCAKELPRSCNFCISEQASFLLGTFLDILESTFFYHPTLKIFKIYKSIKEMDPSIYEWCPSAILQTSWLIRKDCLVSSWNWSLWENSSSHWITTGIRKVLSLASPFLQTESKTFWFPFVPLIKLLSLSSRLTILYLALWCQCWGSAKHISVSHVHSEGY